MGVDQPPRKRFGEAIQILRLVEALTQIGQDQDRINFARRRLMDDSMRLAVRRMTTCEIS